MYLAKVIGTVVAERKAEGLAGIKLLVVQPLEGSTPSGEPHVACDTVQAGPGDRVWCVSSREAALALEQWFVPVDAAIVGIAEQVTVTPLPRPATEKASSEQPAGRANRKVAR